MLSTATKILNTLAKRARTPEMGLSASGPLGTPLVELTRDITPMMPILALTSTPNQPMFKKLLSSKAPMMAANMPKHQTRRGAEGAAKEEDVRRDGDEDDAGDGEGGDDHGRGDEGGLEENERLDDAGEEALAEKGKDAKSGIVANGPGGVGNGVEDDQAAVEAGAGALELRVGDHFDQRYRTRGDARKGSSHLANWVGQRRRCRRSGEPPWLRDRSRVRSRRRQRPRLSRLESCTRAF